MATITFSGLSGSGLDTSSWVDALVSVRQTTITSLQAQKEAQQKLLSVVNNIKSFFSSFQTCLQKITDSQFGIASLDLFMQNLATSSNTNILTATATTDAARQTYDVLVDQLATSTKATSGYTKTETKYATLDTTLGKLGAKSGTITVNNQSFTVSENDTIKDLIDKFSNVGVVASFDSKKSRFTVGVETSKIDDGTTGLKRALGLQNTNISGVTSGSIVYANKDTRLSDLGLKNGTITLNLSSSSKGGVFYVEKTADNKYNFTTYGGPIVVDTIGDFLNLLKKFGAEDATIDDSGNISIRGCVIKESNGANIKEILNLGDVKERTVMSSGQLRWNKTNVADWDTTLKDLGITSTKTLIINQEPSVFNTSNTLKSIKDYISARYGVDMTVDENGVISIDTNGVTVSGTLLDALGLVADKSGTTLTSNAHTVTYKATGSTKLSALGIANTDSYTAYKSDGTAITGTINNLANMSIDDFVANLKTKGLDASFNEDTQQIVINDGYITGDVATKLGMTSTTETHQEAATADTTLEKLGATGNQTMSINGGTAKSYDKTAKLSDVIADITAAGGKVEFKDGTMAISGVTLTGTLPALLGFSATTKGTSVTSGALSVVTNSSSTSTSGITVTTKHNITRDNSLSQFLSGWAADKSFTLSINGGAEEKIYNTAHVSELAAKIEAAGGTFTINDDSTITIENVTLSGTLVTALGLASVGTATSMTSNRAITVGGVENFVTESNTLADLGATGDTKLSIDGGTAKTYAKTTSLSTIFADIRAAGGTAEIKDGVITVSGVNLSGTAVDLLGLEATQTGTTITSGNLNYVSNTTSTSSESLHPVSISVVTSATQLKYLNSGMEPVVYVSDVSDFTVGSTYHISTVDDLNKLAALTNSGANTAGVKFVLDNDIDMSSVANFATIGKKVENSFRGVFDGQGHQIKNLKMSVYNGDYEHYGFFGYVEGGTVQNLGIANGSASATSVVGLLVGQGNNMTVTNCWSSGSVSAGGGYYIGGLIGNMNSSTVTGSYSTATVSGSSQSKGGLIGQIGFNGQVSNCYATGEVTDGSMDGTLVGNAQNADISNCYTTGSGTLVGGTMSSSTASTFTNCVYTGDGTGSGSTYTFTNCAKVSASDLKSSSKMAKYGFTTENGWVFESGNKPILMATTGANVLYINGTKLEFSDTTTLSGVAYQIKKYGGSMTINDDGSIDISGVTLYGGLASRLGLTVTGKSTSMSSNNAITVDQSFLIERSTTFGTDLGLADDDSRSYNIYDNYGNVIQHDTTMGTKEWGVSGAEPTNVSGWLWMVNQMMNSYYGTTDVEYAKISNGVISVDGGYITGNLATALGMKTSSTVSGKALVGGTATYKEDSKFIGQVSNQIIPTTTTRVKNVSSFTEGETYYVSDASDLKKLAELANAGKDTSNVTFIMTNDIDMSSVSNFAGIGTFKGTFLGNGYEIKNLKMSGTSAKTGLFGTLTSATIKDLGLSNITISTRYNGSEPQYTGALAGYTQYGSTIENCYVSGGTLNNIDRSSATSSYSAVGGLVGQAHGSNINNCYSNLSITADGTHNTTVGGLIGNILNSTVVSNSYTAGNITMKHNGQVGGFIGSITSGTIDNSYSINNVKSTYSYNNVLGGFIGYQYAGTILNAYAAGKVETAYEGAGAKLGGFIGYYASVYVYRNNCVYNTESGTVNNGAGYADQGSGVSGYTMAQINANNALPKLAGKNPYIYREIQTNTTLSKLGLSTEADRTINVAIDGRNNTHTFDSTATVQDVVDYLNGLNGVSASFNDSQLRIASNTSQDISASGKLATALFGDSMTESTVYETHNTSDKLYHSIGNSAISESTRVGDLLGTSEGGTLSLLIQDVAQITLSYSADSTVGDILNDLASYGINASVSNSGVFTATSSNQVTMSGDVGRALLGANGSTTYANSKYSSDRLSVMNQLGVNGGVTLDAFGISSGNIQIIDEDGNLVTNFEIDNTQTLSQLASSLSAYGLTLTIDSTHKTISVSSTNGNKLADGTSNLVSQLKLDDWTDTTAELTSDTTLAQMGFADGAAMTVVLDGSTTMNLSFGANNTVDDIITSLAAFGITATVTDGVFSATSNSHSFVFSGDLASYLSQGGTYINQEVGYESSPLTYNTSTTVLKSDTTIADLLGGHDGGTLRLTLDGNVINMNYNADDTVQNVIDDLANLGITATISNTGVFSASSNDKTFVLSGDIGRALQGGAPTYTQLDKKYQSGDLSFNTTSALTNNTVLKDIGITSGSIFLLDRNGNVINTIDIDENMTINQTKAALKSYGIDMSLSGDRSPKIIISSNDGYSLTDGSSNMISKFKLPAFTQTTAKLSADTTLAQMGFKDGADLNLLLDGTTPTTISFGATDTMQDIMNALNALGINTSINATNGAFTATSTEHSFVFSGDLGKFLTSGTAGYVNSDKGYITDDPLMVDVPVVTNTSKNLTYSHALASTDTLESMGFADGGVVRLILDGTTPYSFSFLATDTMQDIMDTLSAYGIQSTIDANGRVSFSNNDHTFTLGGELGSYLTNGGAYTNTTTGYTSDPLSYTTTPKADKDTKLSDMGVASGALNIIKNGEVAATIQIDDDTTIGQLFSAIKPYGMVGVIDDGNIKITSEGDTYLADGTCDAVTKLGLSVVNTGDYDGHVEYWKAGATSGLLTEDTLLTSLDKDGKTSVGSLIFELGTGDDKTQHIVNISATDTIKSFLDKMEAEGVHAVLDNGVIKLDNSVDGFKITGGSSGIQDTLGLTAKNVAVYSTSSRALTYDEDVTYSVANYADQNTLLSTVNVTDGKMSIFVDGIKAEVQINATDKFSDVFSRISSTVAAKTGVTVRAGFVDTDGNIVTNPDADKNTGIIGIEVVGDHNLVIGASNDTTNFATIANLKQQTPERVAGSRALYKVNGNSLITGAGLFKDGDITAGTFTIGDATFTIDDTTTLNSLINQINKSDKSYASAYWDTLSGTLVLQSTLSGESLINIESGTSNFTKIMGFTETVDGKETLLTDRQTLGQNAIVKINGTTVTSTSNTITSDISKIKGLTINLKGVSAGETVTITVEQDDEGIYNAVNDIIDSYNTLMEGLEKELGDGGSFEHDTMFSMMKNQLKRLMTQTVGGTTVYKNLAAIGISTGEAKDSISTDVTNLLIDKDKFMQALDKDSDAVKQLLVGTTTNPGVFLKVNQIVDSTLKTTGYIASTENSINKNIKKMTNKISDLTTALTRYREQLENKFNAMERTISNMQNSYSSFLRTS